MFLSFLVKWIQLYSSKTVHLQISRPPEADGKAFNMNHFTVSFCLSSLTKWLVLFFLETAKK
jgi:hypothetical protein